MSEIVLLTCCNCAVEFGLSSALNDRRKADYQAFYCPNGHGQSYRRPAVDSTDTDLKKLKADLAEASAKATVLQNELDALKVELEIWRPRSDGHVQLLLPEGKP